ncbi:MAG TPA: glycosyltransferase family 39 protein [Bryobacteraceae bacterium]|jgi:uncharacterized membrane protein
MGSVAKESFRNARLRTPGNANGAPENSQSWGRFGLWLAAITALAAVLRVIGLNTGLWWDEIYFLIVSVRHPLSQILTVFPSDNQHPLYTVLAWLSIHVLGEHVWSLRLPALIFGVASIPMLYLVGASVASRTEALLAAAFLAVSYHHVWFSQDARGYSTLAFWALASTYFLLQGIRTGRRGPWIAYAVAAALGIYTHVTMVFLVASHVLICAAMMFSDWRSGSGTARWRFPILAFLLAGGLTLLFYAPILAQVQNFFLHRPSPMKAVSTPRWAIWETVRVLILGLGGKLVILLGAGLVVACGAWSYLRQSRFVFALFALPVAITAVGAFLGRGTMYPRFYFFLIGFAVLILIRGIVVIPRWIAGSRKGLESGLTATLATILLAASAYSLIANYRYPKQDYEGAIRFVETAKKNEVVLTAGAATYPLRQYYAKPWDSVETPEKLKTICKGDQPVWVVYTMPRYLEAAAPGVMEMIRKEFTVIRVFHGTLGDGDVYVGQYNRPA